MSLNLDHECQLKILHALNEAGTSEFYIFEPLPDEGNVVFLTTRKRVPQATLAKIREAIPAQFGFAYTCQQNRNEDYSDLGPPPAAGAWREESISFKASEALKFEEALTVAKGKLSEKVAKELLFGDPVNHPSHYNAGKIEVIEFIEDQGLRYHQGNAIKYICRAGRKNRSLEIEDLKKAVWYLRRAIEIAEAQTEGREVLKPNAMVK